MNTNKIIEKAKESYDRYFKDAPVFPENHEQDVVCNAEEIEKIIEKKKAQLDGHVENLNAYSAASSENVLFNLSVAVTSISFFNALRFST